MAEILIHPKTQSDINRFLSSPAQVIAVIGANEAGSLEIAKLIISNLLHLDESRLDGHYRLIHIRLPQGKQEIPIEEIRSLIRQLRVRAPGDEVIRRVVLIEESHLLSEEAQNALLKILEQPNPDTIFVLTLESAGGILPTVMSRATRLVVHGVSLEQAHKHYSQYPKKDVESAWNLSEGAAALLHQLLTCEQESDLKLAIDQAKAFISQDKFQRLLSLDQIGKDRHQLALFLEALGKVLKAIHHSQIKRGASSAARILRSRKSVKHAQQAVASNASPKLAMLNLIQSLEV